MVGELGEIDAVTVCVRVWVSAPVVVMVTDAVFEGVCELHLILPLSRCTGLLLK